MMKSMTQTKFSGGEWVVVHVAGSLSVKVDNKTVTDLWQSRGIPVDVGERGFDDLYKNYYEREIKTHV